MPWWDIQEDLIFYHRCQNLKAFNNKNVSKWVKSVVILARMNFGLLLSVQTAMYDLHLSVNIHTQNDTVILNEDGNL